MNYTKLNMDEKEYNDYVENKAAKSTIFKNCVFAFIVGGFICIIGQIIKDICLNNGIDELTAATITSAVLIFIGALLTSLRLYKRIGKYAGAGSIVPITGFSNSIVSPAIEYKSEGLILGVGSNMFKVAGPVLVYGISTSIIVGFIYWIFNYIL